MDPNYPVIQKAKFLSIAKQLIRKDINVNQLNLPTIESKIESIM